MSTDAPTPVDVLIVGGGPSGLSTALSLSRACYTAAVFDSGTYRNESSHHMHMMPTWDHQDPIKFREAARKELTTRYETIQLVDQQVASVKKDETGKFLLIDAIGKSWIGRKLVLAIGVKDVFPDIEGYADCWIKGIFHCLFCHGYEDRGAKSVGVLAVDLLAMIPPITDSLARNALQFTGEVTIYTNGSEEVASKIKPMLEKKKEIKFDTRPIKNLVKGPTEPQVMINFQDGSSVLEGFLVHAPQNKIDLDFAKDLNLECTPSGGELEVQPPFNETTEPGCFAAGDIVSIAKVVVAGVAFGSFAATGIVKQLQAD